MQTLILLNQEGMIVLCCVNKLLLFRYITFWKQGLELSLIHIFPVKGIEENIPLDWNEKVMVEKYG